MNRLFILGSFLFGIFLSITVSTCFAQDLEAPSKPDSTPRIDAVLNAMSCSLSYQLPLDHTETHVSRTCAARLTFENTLTHVLRQVVKSCIIAPGLASCSASFHGSSRERLISIKAASLNSSLEESGGCIYAGEENGPTTIILNGGVNLPILPPFYFLSVGQVIHNFDCTSAPVP